MLKIKIIFFFILIFNLFNITNAEIYIKYKVGEEIITNIDILEEKKYLIFLRPSLKDLSKNEIEKIAENSLKKEIIKKKEIDRIFKDTNDDKLINEIKKSLFKFKNVKSDNEFVNLLKVSDIKYDKIINKMKYEGLWNELIFQKYSPMIKINEEDLKKKLIIKTKNNKKYEYNLSELLFETNDYESLNKKYKEILEYIKTNNFKIATSRYSIANSSKVGGEIGWIKETLLSNNLNTILSKMKVNQISKPIKFPNGYLILKINGKKEIIQKIDVNKELKDVINYEKNKQLSQFSLLYYKKLKSNTVINEY